MKTLVAVAVLSFLCGMYRHEIVGVGLALYDRLRGQK